MKKFLALLLSAVMVFALVACGGGGGTTEPATPAAPATTTPATPATPAEPATPATPATPAAPAAADMKVAMITDYGDITDQSFNQTTYEAAKSWSESNGVDFTYFKPASDSDDDRVAMIEKAIDEGYTVIVMPGYAFGPAIVATAPEYSDVTFIALDVSAGDLGDGFQMPANLYCAVYQEELCGYMAGYAAVKLGYSKLGFLGGMAVPAVVRYGYGFVQGADAAAAADGKTDVSIKYAYGNQFYGDGDITAAMDTWYAAGTEVVFACGGGIFTSAGEAAAKVGGKVIGVDVDQAPTIDGLYGANMTVTSAMKGLAATVNTLLTQVKDGSFAGGKVDTLGLVSANPEENYVQIPMGSTQWSDSFSKDDYKALVGDMFGGKVTVSNDITKAAGDFATVTTVEDLGNIK
ncbi:MAG: BMP family ABC transporter substrate-binding protein [Ruminococcaceae bacterium]|nr:BMP family ABC transporter substrate-binding protein [Oscillospiraceae bacterium]